MDAVRRRPTVPLFSIRCTPITTFILMNGVSCRRRHGHPYLSRAPPAFIGVFRADTVSGPRGYPQSLDPDKLI